MTIHRFGLVALLFCAACAGSQTRPEEPQQPTIAASPEAQQQLDAAKALLEQGKNDQAAQAFAALVEKEPGTGVAEEAQVRRGQALSRAGKLKDAQAALGDFLDKHPTSRFKHEAAVELGIVQAKLGKKQDAAQTLKAAGEAMSEQDRKRAAAALSEAFAQGGDAGESAKWGATAVDAASDAERPQRLNEYLAKLESAPAPTVAHLAAQLDHKSVTWAPTALKLARIQLHLGDRTHALQMAEEVAGAGGTGSWFDDAKALRDELRSTSQVKPNLIGIILPLTGRFKAFAESMLDAISLQIDLQNRGPLQVSIKDSKNEPDVAQQAVEDLAKEGAIAILGPIGLAEGTSAAVRAQQLSVPIISLARAEGLTQLGPYVFREMVTSSQQARAVARYAMEKLSAKTFGVLQPESPTGEDLTRFFWDAVAAGNGEVRGFEHYPDRSTNFKKTIQRLVGRDNLAERREYVEEEARIAQEIKDPYRRRKALAQLRNSAAPIIDFDALFIPDFASSVRLLAPAIAAEDVITNGCDQKEVDIIRKTTKKEDLRTVQLLGWMGWDSAELVDERMGAARYVQCSIFVDGFFPQSERPATKKFVDQFQSTYSRQPLLLEAHAHDAAGILKSVIQASHPQTRDDLRAALSSMQKPFPGAAGDTLFGPDREANKQLFWLWINRGQILEFDPTGQPPVPPVASAQAEAPARP